MASGLLKFFFDYGAGGCLWVGDNATRSGLDVGSVDATIYDLQGQVMRHPSVLLTNEAIALRERLNREHAEYLNPIYPPDPSLWTQAKCDHFNDGVERLLMMLRNELGDEYQILDEQERYIEHPSLGKYLAANPNLKAIK